MNNDIDWVISSNNGTDVAMFIFPNDKEIAAKTDSVDHARKTTKEKRCAVR